MIWKKYELNKVLILSYTCLFLILIVMLFGLIGMFLNFIESSDIFSLMAGFFFLLFLLLFIFLMISEIKRYRLFRNGLKTDINIKKFGSIENFINKIKNKIPCDRVYLLIPFLEQLGGQYFLMIDSDEKKMIQLYPRHHDRISIIISPSALNYKKVIERLL